MSEKLNAIGLNEIKEQLSQFKRLNVNERRPRSTEIGKLFDQISSFLSSYGTQANVIDYLYTKVPVKRDDISEREQVIDHILSFLSQINELSAKSSESKYISIPLYDIKLIGALINILIVDAIYAILPSKYLIPLQMRRLKDFRIPLVTEKIDFNENKTILDSIISIFLTIFKSDSDLKDLIIVGVGFTDILNITIALHLNDSNQSNHYLSMIADLESCSSTYQLFSFYTLLMKYATDPSLKTYLKNELLPHLMVKKNGVESIIDLILGLRENEEVDINRLHYSMILILNSKPIELSIETYYSNIFDQIFHSLVLVNRPIMCTVLVELLLLIYLKDTTIVQKFVFNKIWNTFLPPLGQDSIILTSGVELNNAFNVCLSIVRCLKHTNQNFLNHLFNPIIHKIWWFAVYQREQNKDADIVLNMIKNIILLDGNNLSNIKLIINNLVMSSSSHWCFANDENNLTMIKYNTKETTESKDIKMMNLFKEVDYNTETFLMLLKRITETDSSRLNNILLYVIQNSLDTDTYKLLTDEDKEHEEEFRMSLLKLVNLKLLQSLLETFRSEIEKSPLFLIKFFDSLLIKYFQPSNNSKLLIVDEDLDSDDEDSDDEQINALRELESLVPIFDLISEWEPSDINEQSELLKLQKNLNLHKGKIPLILRDSVNNILKIDTNGSIKEKRSNDNDKLQTILVQINDSTPSIRVYALDELTKLTMSNTNTETSNLPVSTKYTLNLLLSQLVDSEPFVYLNCIKNLAQLITFDRSNLDLVLSSYTKANKTIDEKLRIGELLTRFVQMNGLILTPAESSSIIEHCLDIIRYNSATKPFDVKLRMSSLSLLGLVCHHVGFGILPYISNIIDVIKGVMTFESEQPELRRAAIIIVHDIISNPKGLEILKDYGQSIDSMLKYVHEFDNDLLVVRLAWETMVEIDEVFKTTLKL